MEWLSRGGGGYTASVETFILKGVHSSSVEYFSTWGGGAPPQWDIYPHGGGSTTSVECLCRGGGTPPQWNGYPEGGGGYTTSVETFILKGGAQQLSGIFIHMGVAAPPQLNIYPHGGGYTTSVECLSRGGGTPPQWNMYP